MKDFKTEVSFEDLCRMCHNAIGEIKRAAGEPSQVSWGNAEEWQKQSTSDQVEYHMRTPGSPPDMSHNKWMANKIKQGYKYGATVDNVAKTHNCLVQFEELPPIQQLKDSIIQVIVDSLVHNK